MAAPMKILSFFNNKGGVGKTTLTTNVAAYLSIRMKYRVLVVDCDPQCNATQLILGDDETINLYWPDDGQAGGPKTLLDIVQPILDGDSEVDQSIVPLPARGNRFSVDLVPGHPRLSSMEDPLSTAWTELPTGKAGGFRTSNWLRSYLTSVSDRYDIALVDVGPSLGSINRSVLLASEYFMTPLGADVFSLLGVRNIAQWMSTWISYYEMGLEFSEKLNKGALEKFSIPKRVGIKHGYVGYTLQQYITKSKKGVRRPTLAFEKILNSVPGEVLKSLSPFFPKTLDGGKAQLGDVPNLYSLIPLAQSVNAPIFMLRSGDGLVGTQYKQSSEYEELVGTLTQRIVQNIGLRAEPHA